jgi:DNA processing protein
MNFTEDRIARAALPRLFEPGDAVGRALIGRLGAYAALRLATGAQPYAPFRRPRSKKCQKR